MKEDSLGDRMKDIEHKTRYFLPRRTYTIIRLDGRSFHTFTKGCERPFDKTLMGCMQRTTLELCQQIMGVCIGYTQSDEITLVLTDFSTITTDAWFGGNLQKMCSISSSIATAEFNKAWMLSKLTSMNDESDYESMLDKVQSTKLANFDARVYTTSDPWEVFNSCLWRQQDASRNSIQMVAQSLYPHKALQNKSCSRLQDMIHDKGKNWNDYPPEAKRGTFVYRKDREWFLDKDAPILTQDKKWFFDKLPMIPQPTF